MLIDEEHVMLETSVEVRLEAQLDNYRIVVAVNVSVHSVKALEDLAYQGRECFGEGDACSFEVQSIGRRT